MPLITKHITVGWNGGVASRQAKKSIIERSENNVLMEISTESKSE
jgi:hypothetical protein